jgi:hypothetical protein
MSIVYIDFERNHQNDIIEIGAIHVKDSEVMEEFHCFVRHYINNNFAYYRCSENSHCITLNKLMNEGISENDSIKHFKCFIDSIDGQVIIKGHGTDVNEAALKSHFTFLHSYSHVTYCQVPLPPWTERKVDPNHIAAHLMKVGSQILSCGSYNHTATYQPTWLLQNKNATHTRLAKLLYGHHCALIDAYELSFFDSTLQPYCCDIHFENIMNFTITDCIKHSDPIFIDV